MRLLKSITRYLRKSLINYFSEDLTKKITIDTTKIKSASEEITKLLVEDITKEFIIICIGSEKYLFDGVGPLIGTLLKEKGIKHKVIGELNAPVDGINVIKIIENIKIKYPNHEIIAIDACLGYKDILGSIVYKNEGLIPRQGINNNEQISQIGTVSILPIIGVEGIDIYRTNGSLNEVYKLASIVVKAIIDFEALYYSKEDLCI